jgi:YbbR domain-containing protein
VSAKITRILSGVFLRNPMAKVLSLLLAGGAWYMIRETISFEKEVTDVPIEILKEDGWAVLSLSEQTVIVTFKGPEDAVWNLDREQVRLALDIRGRPALEAMALDLTPEQVRSPRGVRPVQVEPNILYITLGQEGQREIEVVPSIQGQLPDGYELVSAECRPSNVVLFGPQQRLDEIEEVRTVPIDLEGRIQSFKLRRSIAPPGVGWVGRVEPDNVMVEVAVVMRSDRLEMKDVPIQTLMTPGSLQQIVLSDTHVDLVLEGRRSTLDTVRPDLVHAYVDCAGLTEPGTNPVPVSVHVPAGVVVREVNPAQVKIIKME